MFCPSCGTAAQPGQKFCTECGAPLAGADRAPAASAADPAPPTGPLPLTPPSWADDAPTLAAPQVLPPPAAPAPAAPAPAAPLADPTPPATNALNVVQQTGYEQHGYAQPGYEQPWAADPTTAVLPAQGGDTGRYTAVSAFRVTPLLAVSVLAAIVSVVTAVVDVASFEVTGDLSVQQSFVLNDFATNLMVGAIIGAVLMVAGAALGAAGYRFGSGLAGGAGLALAGMFAWTIGQVIALFDRTEVGLLEGGGSFTLTTTQEVGFWLAVVAAGLGVVGFALSLAAAGRDGRGAINPAVGVLGAFGTLAVVVGPLIPMHGAAWGDNFSNDFIPPATLLLRLAVVVLVGVGGLVGFLANRRWGLGLALGSIGIAVWQWVTALGESGDIPLGIAGGNPGATDYAPHVVTTIGLIVMLLAIVGGLVAISQQRPGV